MFKEIEIGHVKTTCPFRMDRYYREMKEFVHSPYQSY